MCGCRERMSVLEGIFWLVALHLTWHNSCSEALRIVRILSSGQSQGSEHKSAVGPGGHRLEASRNFWDSSGLKVDSASTDVAWGHGCT